MAIKKPVCFYGGKAMELQAGDTLESGSGILLLGLDTSADFTPVADTSYTADMFFSLNADGDLTPLPVVPLYTDPDLTIDENGDITPVR